MKKEQLLRLVTVSGLILLSGTPVFADDISETIADNSAIVISTPTGDTSASNESPNQPVSTPSDGVDSTVNNDIVVPDNNGTETTVTDSENTTSDTETSVDKTIDDGSSSPTDHSGSTPNESEPSVDNQLSNKQPTSQPSEVQPVVNEEVSQPVTKEVIDEPIVTMTGARVVGTQGGRVIVQTDTGTALKEAKEIGGKLQKDGTVVIKKSDGKMEVLPNTGEAKTIFTVLGIVMILGAIWVGFKENIKKFLTIFSKKEK